MPIFSIIIHFRRQTKWQLVPHWKLNVAMAESRYQSSEGHKCLYDSIEQNDYSFTSFVTVWTALGMGFYGFHSGFYCGLL